MTITEQALGLDLAVPAWPYPGVATVRALITALGAAGEPAPAQEQAVRQFMLTPAWQAAPGVLHRDVHRWLGLLWMSAAEMTADTGLAFPSGVPGFTGQGWSTQETEMAVRWLLHDPAAWEAAMEAARAYPGNPHAVADTLHEHIVPRTELEAIAAAGGDPAKVNWLEIAHELIERRDDPRPVSLAAVTGLTGDGHGHHVPGTPMVYRHGWKPAGAPAARPAGEAHLPGGEAPAGEGDWPATVAHVAKAAAESRMYTQSEAARLTAEIKSLRDELNQEKKTESRARLALRLGFIGVGAVFAAITGGLALPAVAVFAAAIFPEVAREVTEYHILEKGHGNAVLHPLAAVKGRQAQHLAAGDAGQVLAQAVAVVTQALVSGGMQSGPAQALARQLAEAWMAENRDRVARALPGSGGITLAHDAPVSPQAMRAPGLPVPDDRTAAAMFTAHRTDDILHELAHARERMHAARHATGELRRYHSGHIDRHLQAALASGHELTANLREHYPEEAAELEQVKRHVGLARSVSRAAKAATTAHLLETSLHEMTHGARHARAMLEDPDPDGQEWEFNADHAQKHLGGAVEHAGKLAEHWTDNYPGHEGRWLSRLGHATAPPEEGKGDGDGRQHAEPQHARYSKGKSGGTVSAQMAAPPTISGQVIGLIGDGHGRHIPGTPAVYRHGWKPVSGGPAGPALASKGRFGTVDSLHAHTRPDGTLTPERQALHDRIIANALAGHASQEHPVATFMGGGPASGKSHLPPSGGPSDSVHIDPDQIKEQLPEYNQMLASGQGGAAAAYTHEESSALSKEIERQAVKHRMNLTLDGVGNSSIENMARRIAAAKAAGYHVRGRYVTISIPEAIKRNRTRIAETGRWVPETVVRDKHAKVSRVFPQLIKRGLLDEAELWDNNVPKGSPPKLIGSKPAGGTWHVNRPAAYRRFLAKAGDAP